jgi:spermidine synthase
LPDHHYSFWITDHDSPFDAHNIAVREFLHSEKSEFQAIDIVMTGGFGKALLLDGRLQSAERDEYIYHESLVHPAMVAGRDSPVSVLVIGGGEGATLREVLRYPSVKRAVMVDIDSRVVECCREYLQEFHRGAFDDPRVEVIIGDGRELVSTTDERFDVVIIDISEPNEGGPAYLLYTEEFYHLVKNILNEGGRMVTQAGISSIVAGDLFSMISRTIARAFGTSHPYCSFVPSFACSWGFALAGIEMDMVRGEIVDEKLHQWGVGDLLYYDGITHFSLFSLPRDLRALISREERSFTDASPPQLTI